MSKHRLLECELGSILLPEVCEVKKPFPGLFAEIGEGAIAINLMVNDLIWEAMISQFGADLPVNPQCELTVIRRCTVHSPYHGRELVVQYHTLATDAFSFKWDLLLEDHGRRAIVGLVGSGEFFDSEPEYKSIVDSFRFK